MTAADRSAPGTSLDPERMLGRLLLAQLGRRVVRAGGARLIVRRHLAAIGLAAVKPHEESL